MPNPYKNVPKLCLIFVAFPVGTRCIPTVTLFAPFDPLSTEVVVQAYDV